jgi:hypothetical protein
MGGRNARNIQSYRFQIILKWYVLKGKYVARAEWLEVGTNPAYN